jgi:hypothetical protein
MQRLTAEFSVAIEGGLGLRNAALSRFNWTRWREIIIFRHSFGGRGRLSWSKVRMTVELFDVPSASPCFDLGDFRKIVFVVNTVAEHVSKVP